MHNEIWSMAQLVRTHAANNDLRCRLRVLESNSPSRRQRRLARLRKALRERRRPREREFHAEDRIILEIWRRGISGRIVGPFLYAQFEVRPNEFMPFVLTMRLQGLQRMDNFPSVFALEIYLRELITKIVA